jgi:hypothetical protein
MDNATLKQEASMWRDRFYEGQRSWSTAHHVSAFGSILCSVGAGALLQIAALPVGYAAVLTSFAAALSSIAAAGGFQRKWRSNRLSRSRVDALLIDIAGEDPNIQELAKQLKEIISDHDREIVRDESGRAEQTRGETQTAN